MDNSSISISNDQSFVSHIEYKRLNLKRQQHHLSQLVFAENGILHIEIEERNIILPPWYCIWIPANTECGFSSEKQDLLLRCVYFESNFCVNPFFKTVSIFYISPLLRQMVRYTEKWNELEEADFHRENFIRAIRQILPDEMKISIQIFLPSSANKFLQSILDDLHERHSEKLSLADVSKKFNLSQRTFQRMFQKSIGLPFSTYLKHVRILKAIELLSTSEISISQVSYMVGYESLQTFSNTFYELTGIRPANYKKQKQNTFNSEND